MPNAVPTEPTNPTVNNPAVTLTTGVVPRGDGFGRATDAFLVDFGQEVYPEAAMTTVITGAPASVTVQLQGTVDGTNWTTLATSTSTTGDTQVMSQQAAPVNFQFSALRVNVSALSGGTSPTIQLTLSAFADKQNLALHQSTAAGGGVTGTAQLVSTGVITGGTAQNAATTGNGTVIDFGSAKRSIAFQVTATGTVTAGQVTLEVSADGVSYSAPPTAAFTNDSAATLANPYVLVTNTTALFVVTNASVRYARARITTNVTGGATCTVVISAS